MNAICYSMDGTRDYHTSPHKWSGSDRESQIYHLYVEFKKMIQINLFIKKEVRVTDIENKLMVTKGDSRDRDKLGINQEFGISGSAIKNIPAMQESQKTWVWSLDREDLLEQGVATHSSILAWRIPRTEGTGGLQFMGSQRVGHNWSDLACMHVGIWD